VISGAHVIVYSKDAEADRAFFRDVLGFASVDAGHGWLIFALPPAEAAFHPVEDNERTELYFMCEDHGLGEEEREVFGRSGSQVGIDHQDQATRRRRSRFVPGEASHRPSPSLGLSHLATEAALSLLIHEPLMIE
jgi:catechol 2,3-dioxygenase-like lactoylglutathione lyase family enzyme